MLYIQESQKQQKFSEVQVIWKEAWLNIKRWEQKAHH